MQHHQRRRLLAGENARAARRTRTTVPSARTNPTVPGCGIGQSSRTPKMVVVESNPEACDTDGHDEKLGPLLVEFGQRPETTKPFKEPREWNGAIPPLARTVVHRLATPDKMPVRHDCGSVRTAWGTTSLARNRTRVLKTAAPGWCGAPAWLRGSQPKMRPLVFDVAAA